MYTAPKRLYYIDWLRILAMVAIFLFHADRFFNHEDWHVKNSVTNLFSTIHISFFNQWMMPLFFILSGAAIFYSLKFRPGSTFLWERVKRILIPFLIVGSFVTSPPQMYLERMTHSQFTGNFFEFWPRYFEGVDMFGGNFAWYGFHLWYLLYLFLFSLILLPLFIPVGKSKTSVISRLSTKFERPWALLMLAIPIFAINVFIDVAGLGAARSTGGWDLFSYMFLLICGYMFFCNENILETIKRIRTAALFIAIILSVTGLVMRFGIQIQLTDDTPVLYLVIMLIRSLRVLCWIIAIIGFGEKYLNFKNSFLKYANEAVLPFYIMHQAVLLIIGYWVVQWEVYSFVKYITIVCISFFSIIAIYDFLIKRFNLLRFLFGLKTLEK